MANQDKTTKRHCCVQRVDIRHSQRLGWIHELSVSDTRHHLPGVLCAEERYTWFAWSFFFFSKKKNIFARVKCHLPQVEPLWQVVPSSGEHAGRSDCRCHQKIELGKNSQRFPWIRESFKRRESAWERAMCVRISILNKNVLHTCTFLQSMLGIWKTVLCHSNMRQHAGQSFRLKKFLGYPRMLSFISILFDTTGLFVQVHFVQKQQKTNKQTINLQTSLSKTISLHSATWSLSMHGCFVPSQVPSDRTARRWLWVGHVAEGWNVDRDDRPNLTQGQLIDCLDRDFHEERNHMQGRHEANHCEDENVLPLFCVLHALGQGKLGTFLSAALSF